MILILSGRSRLDYHFAPHWHAGANPVPQAGFQNVRFAGLLTDRLGSLRNRLFLTFSPLPYRPRLNAGYLPKINAVKYHNGIIPLPLLGGSINLLFFPTLCQVPGQKITPEIFFEKYRLTQIILEICSTSQEPHFT